MSNTKDIFRFSGFKAMFKIFGGMYLLLAFPALIIGILEFSAAAVGVDLGIAEQMVAGWNVLTIPFIAMFEEVTYVLPVVLLYALHRDVKSQAVSKMLLLLCLAVLPYLSYEFMIGHAYQGTAMYPKGIYVLFSSVMMTRYGLLTSMAAHFFYDFSALGAVKILLTLAALGGI